jgi:hypothetical protein
MPRTIRVFAVLLLAILVTAEGASAEGARPDHYLCYRAGSVLGRKRPPISQARVELEDRLGGPHRFAVRLLGGLCNPASVDGSVVSHPNVHLAGLTIKRSGGTPKLVPSRQKVRDLFAIRTLLLERVSSLLDVTSVRPGTDAPIDLNDDPTRSAIDVNRFECYAAALLRDAPKPVPPSAPTVSDDVFPNGQQLVIKRVTKVCLPTDADGATPGAAGRDTLLVCYAVQLPKGATFPREIVALRSRTAGVRVVGRRKPAELCVVGRRTD